MRKKVLTILRDSALVLLFLCHSACLLSLKDETVENPPVPIAGSYVIDFHNARNHCTYEELSPTEYRVTCRALALGAGGKTHVPLGVADGLELQFGDPQKLFGAEISYTDCGVNDDRIERCYHIELTEPVSTKIAFDLEVKKAAASRLERGEVLIPYSIESIGLVPQFPLRFQVSARTMSVQGRTIQEQGFQTVKFPLTAPFSQFTSLCFRGNDLYLSAGQFVYKIEGTKNPLTGRITMDDEAVLFAGSANPHNREELSHRLRVALGEQTYVSCRADSLLAADGTRLLSIPDEGPVKVLVGEHNGIRIDPDVDAGNEELANLHRTPAMAEPAPDGSVYFISADRIYRYAPSGTITRVMGGVSSYGVPYDPVRGSPALDVHIMHLSGFFVADSQTIYVKGTYEATLQKLDLVSQRVIKVDHLPRDSNGNPVWGVVPELGSYGYFARSPVDNAIYFSDGWTGERIWRFDEANPPAIFAGTVSESGYEGDGLPVTNTSVRIGARDLAFAPDGTMYFIQAANGGSSAQGVRKITPEGIVEGLFYNSGEQAADGTEVSDPNFFLSYIRDVEIGENGSLYLTTLHGQVRRLDADGRIWTIAGDGGNNGGDGPALSVSVRPSSLHLAADGNIYFGEANERRVRRLTLSPQGDVVTTIAAGSSDPTPGQPFSAWTHVTDVASDASGAIYITGSVIRRVAPDGTVTIFGGGGTSTADRIPATQAQLFTGNGLEVSGRYLYFTEGGYQGMAGGNTIRVIDMQASPPIVRRIAGTGEFGMANDGGDALSAQVGNPTRIAADGTGRIYFIDQNNTRLRLLEPVSGSGIDTNYKVSTLFGGSSSKDCGTGTVEGLSQVTSLISDIRASLGTLCSAYLTGLDVANTCSEPDGKITIVLSQQASATQGQGNIIRIVRPCE